MMKMKMTTLIIITILTSLTTEAGRYRSKKRIKNRSKERRANSKYYIYRPLQEYSSSTTDWASGYLVSRRRPMHFGPFEEDMDFSRKTLTEIHKAVQNRDKSKETMNSYLAGTIDYALVPIIDIATIATVPASSGTSLLIGPQVRLPLQMFSKELRAQNEDIKNNFKHITGKAVREIFFKKGDWRDRQGLRHQLFEINKERDSEKRAQLIESFYIDLEQQVEKIYVELNPKEGKEDARKEMVRSIQNFLTDENLIRKMEIDENRDQINQNKEIIVENRRDLENYFNKFNSFSIEVEDNFSELEKISKTMLEYGKQTQNSILKVQEYQIKFSKATLESMNLLDNKVNALLINEYVKMDPIQRQEALKEGGLLAHLDSGTRERMKEENKPLLERQEFFESANNILYGSQTFLNIAANLGVDQSVLKPLNTIVGISGPFLQIASGNPLAVLGGINGLLSLNNKKVDIAEERHKQVMKALGVLQKGQTHIMEMVEEVLKGQQVLYQGLLNNQKLLGQLLEGQENLYEKLNDIEIQLEERLEKLNKLVVAGINETLYNRKLLIDILSQDENRCDDLLDEMKRTSDSLEMKLENKSEMIKKCRKALREKSLPNNGSNLFSIASHQQSYYQKNQEDRYKLMLALHKSLGEKYLKFNRLIVPVKNIIKSEDLTNKISDNKSGSHLSLYDSELSFSKVQEFVHLVQDIQPYLEIGAQINELDLRSSLRDIKLIYDRMVDLSSIMLAQESVKSGMVIIPKLYEERQNRNIWNNVNKAFAANPEFLKNYIHYYMIKRLKKKKISITSYEIALASRNEKFFRDSFSEGRITDIGFNIGWIIRNFENPLSYEVEKLNVLEKDLRKSEKILKSNTKFSEKYYVDLETNDFSNAYKTLIKKINNLKKSLSKKQFNAKKNEILLKLDDILSFSILPSYKTNLNVSEENLKQFNTLQSHFVSLRNQALEIRDLIHNFEIFNLRTNSKKIIPMPTAKALLSEKVFRTHEFEKAYELYEDTKIKHFQLEFDFEALFGEKYKDNEKLKKYMFYLNTFN